MVVTTTEPSSEDRNRDITKSIEMTEVEFNGLER